MHKLVPPPLMLACALLLAGLVGSARADDYGRERYPIPGHGTLVLNEPKSWQAQFVQPGDDGFPSIVMYPLDDQRFELFITVFWHDGYDRNVTSAASVRALVERVGAEVLKMSDQSKLDLEEIPGLSQPGYMYELDDSSAGEGEYSHVAQGALAVGDLVVTFTLLTNDPASPDEQTVLEMLRTARQVGGARGMGARGAARSPLLGAQGYRRI